MRIIRTSIVYIHTHACTVSVVEMLVLCDNTSSVLCCLAVQLQGLIICVTTNSPESGQLPKTWHDIVYSNKYWYIVIRPGDFIVCHGGQQRVLQWALDDRAGNTFGCCILKTGELHFYHNVRDLGVVWEELPTDQPLWGAVCLCGWKVEANYVIPKGEAVTCGEVVCGVMFVSLNNCIMLLSLLVLRTSHGCCVKVTDIAALIH